MIAFGLTVTDRFFLTRHTKTLSNVKNFAWIFLIRSDLTWNVSRILIYMIETKHLDCHPSAHRQQITKKKIMSRQYHNGKKKKKCELKKRENTKGNSHCPDYINGVRGEKYLPQRRKIVRRKPIKSCHKKHLCVCVFVCLCPFAIAKNIVDKISVAGKYDERREK